MYDFLFV